MVDNKKKIKVDKISLKHYFREDPRVQAVNVLGRNTRDKDREGIFCRGITLRTHTMRPCDVKISIPVSRGINPHGVPSRFNYN
jgi:hypothetical protein